MVGEMVNNTNSSDFRDYIELHEDRVRLESMLKHLNRLHYSDAESEVVEKILVRMYQWAQREEVRHYLNIEEALYRLETLED